MDNKEFSSFLRQVKQLTPRQRESLRHSLEMDEVSISSMVSDRENELDRSRKCIYCGSDGVVKNGRSEGLIRFRCRNQHCLRTYNALTGTNLTGLAHKEKWEQYVQCMREHLTIQESAQRCGISYRTSFHWRHRFLKGIKSGHRPSDGIDVDEKRTRAEEIRQPDAFGETSQGTQETA